MRQMQRVVTGLAVLAVSLAAAAGPEQDREAFRDYYQKRFNELALEDFGNGAYALNAQAFEHWQEIEDFPPYEFAIDEGREAFEAPFADGSSLGDCFDNGGIGIAQRYPYFDTDRGEVVTLPMAINECRERSSEDPWPWLSGPLAAVAAYMTYTSRGNPIELELPGDERALAAFEAGKRYYYTRRGQLNFACKSCHVQNAGMMLRAERLSPSLGHTTHWPVHRGKWDELGTIHRRFRECNEQVRAVPLEPQSAEYRNLEFFLRYMDAGLPVNGPAYRK